ncbi:MAG: FAD-dependent oxidoreductase, partial [Myxococcota bacterium]
DAARLRLAARVANAARRGELPAACASLHARPDPQADDALHLTLTLPSAAPVAGLDGEELPALAREGRALMTRALELLRAEHEGFGNARVVAWPARVGIRETRRLRGRAVVERDDVLSGRRRDDEVARSGWPIELWEDHRRARFAYPAAPCSIPLGALVSGSHPGLGAAGRCLSASHEAHGALRVIGTALATGEAIGVAAALAAAGGETLAAVAPARVRARINDDAEKPLP